MNSASSQLEKKEKTSTAMIRRHPATSVSGYPLPLKINSRRKTLLSGKDVVEKYPEIQKEIPS